MRATWRGHVLAESDATIVVEGNHYFPRESVVAEHVTDSDTTTICPWKGRARYLTIEVEGMSNPDAAWYYPDPFVWISKIRGRVAFRRGVTIES
jgi:uncharacterized protein (DUF427 family)